MNQNYKTFRQYFEDVFLNQHLRNTYVSDKRLTKVEKEIIKAYSLIRDNKNEASLPLLKSQINLTHFDFLLAHINLAIGLAHNNLSLWEESRKYLSRAFELFSLLQEHSSANITAFLLGICSYNEQNIKELKNNFDLIKNIKTNHPKDLLRKARVDFLYNLLISNLIETDRALEDVEKLKSHFGQNDISSHYLCVFMYAIKIENFKLAYQSLENLKQVKKFYLKENYQFMKSLLNYLTEDKPIYLRECDLENIPILMNQLMVIRYLSEANFEMADFHWNNLKSFSNNLYQDNFYYNGDKCLFSLALQKSRPKKVEQIEESLFEGLSIQEKIISILEFYDGPVSKEHLYKLIWKEEAKTKDELFKLTREISKIRKKGQYEILNLHGSYTLVTHKAA